MSTATAENRILAKMQRDVAMLLEREEQRPPKPKRPKSPTVREYAETWRRFAELNLDPRSERLRYFGIKPFVAMYGDREIDTITRQDAFRYADAHPNQIRWAKSLINSAMKDGSTPQEFNPFWKMRTPDGSKRGRADLVLPSMADVYRLDARMKERSRGVLTFIAYTGVRIGELFALRGADLDGDVLTVSTQLTYSGWRKPLKGGSAPRRVLVPPEALEGVRWPQDPAASVWPIKRWEFSNDLKSARYWTKLDFSPHVLRHLYANNLVEAGADARDVAAMLGHKDDQLVRRLYGRRVDPEASLERLRGLGS